MIDFEVQRCTRRCAASDRELRAGETFYSVLVSEGADVARYDYSEENWPGPPEKSLGWWKSRMPDADARKVSWAPSDVMLHYFEQLTQQPEQQDLRYVLALLMIRRRLLRLEDTERDEEGNEILVLSCPRNEASYTSRVLTPDPRRTEEIQEQLVRLLFADAQPRGDAAPPDSTTGKEARS